jgi:hypothetical protein
MSALADELNDYCKILPPDRLSYPRSPRPNAVQANCHEEIRLARTPVADVRKERGNNELAILERTDSLEGVLPTTENP